MAQWVDTACLGALRMRSGSTSHGSVQGSGLASIRGQRMLTNKSRWIGVNYDNTAAAAIKTRPTRDEQWLQCILPNGRLVDSPGMV